MPFLRTTLGEKTQRRETTRQLRQRLAESDTEEWPEEEIEKHKTMTTKTEGRCVTIFHLS